MFHDVILTQAGHSLLNDDLIKLQTKFFLPMLKKNQFFLPHFSRKLSNGEKPHRIWLICSSLKKCSILFCLQTVRQCMPVFWLFGLAKLCQDFEQAREVPGTHKRLLVLVRIIPTLTLNKTIDEENEKNIKAETKHWNKVLKGLLYIIQFLRVQELLF